MKKLIYILLFTLISLGARAQRYHLTFDTSDFIQRQDSWYAADTTYIPYTVMVSMDTTHRNNKWQIGKPNKSVFTSAYSFPNAIVTDTLLPCMANDTSIFVLKVPKRDWLGFARLSFYYQLDIDTGDIATIEVQYDTIHNWLNVLTDRSGVVSFFREQFLI